jgi:serine/threonine protein kinase/Tol biopolymer transport system component
VIADTLLHYRILRPLASGGMGDVYVAEDTKLHRQVALKVLPTALAQDAERRQRFEREARAVATLNHPNIVTIHSIEQDAGVSFLTMELVEGRTLSALTPGGGLPVDDLLRVAIPLVDAVAAAHERGITHRDLKPANVMVTAEGRVKVLDFGLAKHTESAGFAGDTRTAHAGDPLTAEGRIVGTVAYMSPEQAEGRTVDHRTDIFSLGVVLYEMATGTRPFTGHSNVALLSSILRDTPPVVTEIKPALPRDLARIIKRALVKDPEHRYQTAKDLRNDLEMLKADLESGAPDATIAAASAPRARSGRRVRVTGTALAMIGASAIAALWYFAIRDRSATTENPFERFRLSKLTSAGTVGWSALSADGRYVAHVVREGTRQSLWLRQVATASNVQIVPPAEVRFDGVSFSPDNNFIYFVIYPAAQSFATAYRVPVLGGATHKIVHDVDTPLTFSPDGNELAFIRSSNARGEGTIVLAGMDGSNERPLVVSKAPYEFAQSSLAWSPDGSAIVAVQRQSPGGGKLVAVDVKSARQTGIGDSAWTAVDSVAWTPDGGGLVIAAQEDAPGATRQIWHVAYPSGEVRRITNDLNSYANVSVSADGRTLAAVQSEALAHLWVAPIDGMDRARQITTGTGRDDGRAGLAWTADQRLIYTSNASGNRD